jgi:hypothetical protein
MEETKKVVKKNKGIVLMITVALITAGLGFYGGVQYQKSRKITGNKTGIQANLPNGSGKAAAGNGNMNRNGNQPVSGEITSIDNGTITVKTQDGGSKIVVLSSSTKINIATEGSTSDLKKGDTVMVIGTTGTDGTVTATTVSIGANPQGVPGNDQPPQDN